MKWFIPVCVLLTACSPPEWMYDRHTLVSSTPEYIVVTAINPPKHFVLSYKDNAGNDHEYRSKNCNMWRQYNVGHLAFLEKKTYTVENGKFPQRNRKYTVVKACGH